MMTLYYTNGDDGMNIIKRHIKHSANKRPMIIADKTSITIHSTGNDRSTARNEVDYLHRPDNKVYASYHYVVGDNVIYEVIPPNEVAYHCGNRHGNWHSIGIEMVHTGNRDKVIDNTIRLTRHLMKRYNISHSNVVRHYDWKQRTNWRKTCPVILSYNNWQGWVEFKTLLRSDSSMTKEEVRKIVREEMKPSIKGGSPNAHWAYKNYERANKTIDGLMTERRFDDMITRGEVITLLERVIDHFEK